MTGESGTLQELETGSFIWQREDALSQAQCQSMIARFEAHPDKTPGRAGSNMLHQPELKRSTDLVLHGTEWKDVDQWLFVSLSSAMRELRQHYPYFRGRFKDQGYAVQRTEVGEYYHWHVDADSKALASRQLVAIWYLNDVPPPGGETEFLHQGVKVSPREGRLILFPPFWTHQHRGVTVREGVKYIATTWVVFA